jgi:tape measure domain-containing protein
MASRDEVLIKIRTQGGKAAASDVRAAKREIDGLGPAGSRASGGLAMVGRKASSLGSQAMSAASRVAKLTAAAGGLAGAGLAAQAAKTGFAYNKMQDSQMVAFSTMLRSESKAKSLMQDIQDLALKSPVLDPGSTGEAVQQLLNYGMGIDKILPLVETLGDASAASGKSIAEVMPRAALALGQIEGKGKLSMEELNQLTEAVGINRKILAKELGMTSEEFADAFKPGKGITSNKAIPAIQRALEAGSSGAAEKLSKTTSGQVDRLREIMSRELGSLTRPAYDAAGNTASGIGDILERRGLSGGQKIRLSFEVAKKEFGPIIRNARQAFKEANVGQEIANGIETYAPRIVNSLGNAIVNGAPKVASAFLRGFTSMGPWGQALTVAFLMKKFHAFGPAGRLLGRSMGATLGSQAISSAAQSVSLRSMYLQDTMKGKLSPRMKSLGGILGKTLGAGLVAAAAYELVTNNKAIIAAARDIGQKIGTESDDVKLLDGTVVDAMGQYKSAKRLKDGESYGEGDLRTLAAMMRRDGRSEAEIAAQMDEYRRRGAYRRRSVGGRTGPGETTLVGERGPEIARFPTGTRITPAGESRKQTRTGMRTRVVREQPINVMLDSKVLYQALSRQTEIRELAH